MNQSTAVSPIPQGYHTATPYMTVKNADKALEFYKKAFHAQEIMRMEEENGKIMHCEFKIGDSPIMMGDEYPEMGAQSPESIGGSAMSIMLYVENVDELFKNAIEAGATQVKAVANQFWGDRMGTLMDPFGHRWTLATQVEHVSQEEMQKRMKAMKH